MYYRQSCFNNIEDYEMPKILSFEILNEKIKISEGEKKGNQLHLIKCVWIKMPQEYVLNGRIKNITSAAELIKLAIRDNGLKGGRAVLLINTNSAFIRKIELPYLKNSKDRKATNKIPLNPNIKPSAPINLTSPPPIPPVKYEIRKNIKNPTAAPSNLSLITERSVKTDMTPAIPSDMFNLSGIIIYFKSITLTAIKSAVNINLSTKNEFIMLPFVLWRPRSSTVPSG
jgi:hypothetical protein